jgi:hypothetical protein
MSNLHLNTGTTGDKGSLLYESTDNTKGIMKRSLSLLKNKLV